MRHSTGLASRLVDFCSSMALDLRFLVILLRIKLRVLTIQHLRGGRFSIIELWDRCVRDHGDEPYLLGPGYRYTYRQCDDMAAGFARQSVLAPGTRVAFVGENLAGSVLRIIGFMKLGVVPVILRASLTEDQLAHFLRGYQELEVLYGTHAGLDGLPAAVRQRFSTIVEIPASADDLRAAGSAPVPSPRVRLEDEVFHVGTSGSGGYSKSVAVHHGALLAFAMAHQAMKDLRRADVVYGLASISHGDGLAIGVVAPWTVGAAVYLEPAFEPARFVDTCVDHGITVLNHIGTLPRTLLRLPVSERERELKLRVSNGHEMLATVWKDFQTRFGVRDVVEYYASSEGTVLFLNKWRYGAAGFIGPISRLLYPFKIVRLDRHGDLITRDGHLVACEPGEVGEVLGLIDPSDPLQHMNSYTDGSLVDGRVLTSAFRDGDSWYRTGDLVRRDRDGFIYFIGRQKLTVEIDGHHVSYPHVEDKILSGQPRGFQLEDCCMTRLEAEPHLLCHLRISGDFDERELVRYLATVLPAHEMPRYVVLREQAFRYTDSHRLYRDLPPIDVSQLARAGRGRGGL